MKFAIETGEAKGQKSLTVGEFPKRAARLSVIAITPSRDRRQGAKLVKAMRIASKDS